MQKESREQAQWRVKTVVEKWASEADHRLGLSPYEVVEREGNLLLNEGIALLLDLLIGAGGTVYSNANARVGVGNSNAAAAASQTGLQGASKAYRPMEATYPSRSGQTLTWRGLFGSADGNFAWEEWTIVNAADDTGTNLNRKVESLGTKAAGAVWQMTVSVTIS